MKCTIPEISWHNRDPVLSVDIQLMRDKENCYRVVTGGADTHVFIWYLTEGESGIANVEFVSDLSRHQKAVNVVRFCPSGEMLASGDDESTIIVWKQKTDQDLPEFPSGNLDEETNINKEHWIVHKILRGHLEDVYDISWSPNSTHLISGSVDNTAILWNVHKGKNLGILSEHRKFVQGVAWDPKDQYVATLSSDRHMRVYSVHSRRVIGKAGRSKLPVPSTHDLHDKVVPLFHDDTMKSFFRRLCFSPDGSLLIAPSGVLEMADTGKKPTMVTHVFTRACFNKPAVCLPSLQHYSVAVRCCPVLFELKPSDEKPLIKLPYRIVISVATENNILLYDTQHATPFAFIANIHYTKLTDITWSSDGRLLIASSTDGYCSIISFGDKELGVPYEETSTEDVKENVPEKKDDAQNTINQEKKKVNEHKSPKTVNVLNIRKASKVKPNEPNQTTNVQTPTEDKPETSDPTVSVNLAVESAAPPSDECPTTPKTPNKAPSGTPNKTPRRVQLITLSSPNRKRKLDDEKIRESIQENSKKLFAAEADVEVDTSVELTEDIAEQKVDNPSTDDTTSSQKKPESEIDSATNKSSDFNFDTILENTGDSILNASFVDDSPKDAKKNDFSDLTSNLKISESNSEKSKESSSFGDGSVLTSPSRDPSVRPPHVFTPPRSVHSPGRRVQLITLSSPKVKSKEK